MTTLTTNSTTAMLKSLNPSTGEVVGEVPITPISEIGKIISNAKAALPNWRNLGVKERAETLRPFSKVLLDNLDELAPLLTKEMGKPLPEARGEIESCANQLGETLDELVDALDAEVLDDGKVTSTIYHDPFGVCAAITPWNFPLAMPHWAVIPALAAGNTVVLKPSEDTPLIAQAYFDLLVALLPTDVLQIIHGDDEQGKALVNSDVDLIVFTGSRDAGKHILGSASGGLKRVILELGGKDPLIVLDDADIDAAAKFAAGSSFRNAGQVCVSTERIYVDEKIADQFETALIKYTNQQKLGDGFEEGVTVGPMINDCQREHVINQIDEAVRQGAKVLAGGGEHPDHFVNPTILTDLNHDHDIMCAETFGPVACVAKFSSDEQAIELANDTPYGLGAAVFGTDQDRAANVARQIQSGMIGINKGCGGASGSPWVGAKQSGFGYHSGKEGHRQFTQSRGVSKMK